MLLTFITEMLCLATDFVYKHWNTSYNEIKGYYKGLCARWLYSKELKVLIPHNLKKAVFTELHDAYTGIV